MSLKSDIILVGVAGVVLLAAAWYAKKKVEGAAADVVDTVTGSINAAGQYLSETSVEVGSWFVPTPETKSTINAPINWIDEQIDSFGKYISGDDTWNQKDWLHRLYGREESFGLLPPGTTWD